MSLQLTHHSTAFEEKKFPLVLVLDGVASPANIGSLFRLADAFNIEKLILCGPEINLDTPRIQKTARSTIGRVNFVQLQGAGDVCGDLKNEGYTLLALEITDDSLPLDSISYKELKKVALIVGNEISGISEGLLNLSDNRLHITMFGKNSSMNVAQSTGIALYEITKSLPSY